MAAPKGNRFWEARSSHGRNPIFASADVLWAACEEYFEWNRTNPLYEEKLFAFQGAVTRAKVARIRAMTISSLCRFLDIDYTTWVEYRTRDHDYTKVTTRAEQVIRDQKFEGAAADLLNANIIARDLGLADRQEHTGKDGGPMQHEVSARDILADKLSRLAARKPEGGDTGEPDGEAGE